MPSRREITDDTRVIDLTVSELLAVLADERGRVRESSETSSRELDGFLDTWAAAKLLGIVPKYDPGLEPPAGTPEWRTWRERLQAIRDEVAHRFQQLLARRPNLAVLARYEGRRRYFVRADLMRYLESLTPPARRLRR